jgi:hypothetical protein
MASRNRAAASYVLRVSSSERCFSLVDFRHRPYNLLWNRSNNVSRPFLLACRALRIEYSSQAAFQFPKRTTVALSHCVHGYHFHLFFLVGVRHVKFGWPLSWSILNFMPLSWNILGRNGIGPLTLRDTFVLNLNSIPDFRPSFWGLVTGASVIEVLLFVFQTTFILIKAWPFISYKRIPFRFGAFIFSLVALLSYFTPILVFGLYDRYIADSMHYAGVINSILREICTF